MKKYTILPVIAGMLVLVAGCRMQNDVKKTNREHEQHTVLTIQNQSSFSIKDIKYNSQTVNLSEEFLLAGESCKIPLADNANGYLYFTLYDEIKKTSFAVRSNNTIIVEKGKKEKCIITDNTLVVERGKTVPIKIFDLMDIAVLKIYNKTSFDIVEIGYGGKTDKSILAAGKDRSKIFRENDKGELSIKIFRKKDSEVITVKLKDEIAVKIGSIKEVIITNTTLAVEEGKTEIRELRYILGMGILNIINQTSANKISNLTFAGKVLEDLPKGSTWSIEFDNSVDNNLFFTMEAEIGQFEVRTEEKIQLINNEKNFIITDDTLVILNGRTDAYKMSSFLNAAGIKITNNSNYPIYNVTYYGTFGTLNSDASTSWTIWEFPQELRPVAFEIYVYSQAIQLTTKETFSLRPGRTTEITITNSTLVNYDGRVVKLGGFHQ